ncbi:hypothetical protein X729_30460 [Mesorhizobium sp. L103C131B0]|nr:hypothetical protein X729_30460 [Mesorhizobium sp. L103C131B0]
MSAIESLVPRTRSKQYSDRVEPGETIFDKIYELRNDFSKSGSADVR